MAGEYVHLTVLNVLRETDAAFLLRLADDSEVWIPKSQMADPEDCAEGDGDTTVSVTAWIAEQKGLG